RVVVLRLDVAAADLDGVELVAADAAIENLLEARLRIERPLAAALYDRHRERPIVRADHEHGAVGILRVGRDLLLLARLRDELRRDLLLACGLAGMNDVLAVGAE